MISLNGEKASEPGNTRVYIVRRTAYITTEPVQLGKKRKTNHTHAEHYNGLTPHTTHRPALSETVLAYVKA